MYLGRAVKREALYGEAIQGHTGHPVDRKTENITFLYPSDASGNEDKKR